MYHRRRSIGCGSIAENQRPFAGSDGSNAEPSSSGGRLSSPGSKNIASVISAFSSLPGSTPPLPQILTFYQPLVDIEMILVQVRETRRLARATMRTSTETVMETHWVAMMMTVPVNLGVLIRRAARTITSRRATVTNLIVRSTKQSMLRRMTSWICPSLTS